MSEKIVQLNEEVINGQIKESVRGSVAEDRKLGLRLVDAEFLVRDEVSLAAFTCEFRVATEIYNEI